MAKILIITEDTPLYKTYHAAICKANPEHEIILAFTGEEGVEAAMRERPDMIILDSSLPVPQGFTDAKSLNY